MGERRYVVPIEFVIFDEGSYCRDLLTLAACARAGALAWGALPSSGAVDTALTPGKVQDVLDVCAELEAAWARRREEVEDSFKQATKDRQRGTPSLLEESEQS